MDTLYAGIRYAHITAGMVALATFAVPLLTQKGGKVHRKVGWVYVYAMYFVAFSGAAIVGLSFLAGERKPRLVFLAFVAWVAFTSAFYGVRVLKQKGRTGPWHNPLDLMVPALLVLFTVVLIVFSLQQDFMLGVYFSPIGFLTGGSILKSQLAPPKLRFFWWLEHMLGMIPACIATLTAFAVTNVGSAAGSWALVAWLGPTVVLVPVLIVWRRHYRTTFEARESKAGVPS